ncbi:hypothetical protein [Gemmata sp.]|uniref:hypothetical protein n=1 Tax=Gemmata sp. TaxID=1914242 RepID=UPI003F71F771
MTTENMLDRLLRQLEQRGLRVVPGAAPGEVRVRGPEHEVTPAVLDALKAFKPQIVERFAAAGRPRVPPPPPRPLPTAPAETCQVCRRTVACDEDRERLADPAFCDRGKEPKCPYKK